MQTYVHNRRFGKNGAWLLLLIFLSLPSLSFAQLVPAGAIIVEDPTAPHTYYAELTGDPHVYHLESTEPFSVYIRLLAPTGAVENPDITAALVDGSDVETPVAFLDGTTYEWEESDNSFQGTTYLYGPVFEGDLEAGIYEIRVWSSNNTSAYGLMIGEQVEDAVGVPSPLSFFLSIVVLGLIIGAIVWGVRKKGPPEAEGFRPLSEIAPEAPLVPHPPTLTPTPTLTSAPGAASPSQPLKPSLETKMDTKDPPKIVDEK